MVTLIVEDGTNVLDANTYADVATVRAYCASRGLSVSDTDDEVAQMIIVAMDYLEAKEYRFKGARTYEEQALSWPRSSVIVGGKVLADNKIPKGIVIALCQLTVEATALDGNLTPTQTEFAIKQEVIGPMSTTYAVDTINANKPFTPTYTKVDAFLRPYLTIADRTYR